MTEYIEHEHIELGDEVRDKVTGYTGIVVAFTTYLNGRRILTVQTKMAVDGSLHAPLHADIEQLELYTKSVMRPPDQGQRLRDMTREEFAERMAQFARSIGRDYVKADTK